MEERESGRQGDRERERRRMGEREGWTGEGGMDRERERAPA